MFASHFFLTNSFLCFVYTGCSFSPTSPTFAINWVVCSSYFWQLKSHPKFIWTIITTSYYLHDKTQMTSQILQDESSSLGHSQSSLNPTTPSNDNSSWLIVIWKGTHSTHNPHRI